MAPKFSKPEAGEANKPAAPEVGLQCQKCGEPTTLSQSLPNGRNALRRNCLECVSTDKWLSRCLKKPKDDTEVEAESQKERRQKAEETKKALGAMSPTEKASWYCKKKEERRTQERSHKRTFGTAVGYVEETSATKLTDQDKDVFETSELWCARQLSLKKFDTLAEAEAAFKAECNKPGARTLTKRGQTLLASFHGVEVLSGQEHALTHGVRQRADLTEEADLPDFKNEVESRTQRAQWRLQADREAFMEGTLEAPSTLLNVAQDIKKAKAAEAELEAQWMESLEITAANKKSEKKPTEYVVKSVAVESMGMQAAMERACQAMNDCMSRQKAMQCSAAEESTQLETDVMREEAKDWEAQCEACLPKIVQDIDKQKGSWQQALARGTAANNAQQIHDAAVQVAKDLKEWLHGCQPLKEYKDLIKNWKSFLAKCKAQSKKKDKAATKAQSSAMSSTKLSGSSSWNTLLLCKQAVDAAMNKPELHADTGVAWSLDKDLLAVSPPQEALPVVFSEGQTRSYCDCMMENEYYKFQKVWVSEQVKKMGGNCFVSAQITKAVVSKKIGTVWTKLVGDTALVWAQTADNAIRDLFVPQFFQQSQEACQAHLHTDFGLPDARLLFEGKCLLVGMPLSKVPGDELADKRAWLTATTWESFLATKTWSVSLQPGKGVVIPGDHCFLSVSLGEDCHGARCHMLLDGHACRTAPLCAKQVKDNASLGPLKTGKLVTFIEDLLANAASGPIDLPHLPPTRKAKKSGTAPAPEPVGGDAA